MRLNIRHSAVCAYSRNDFVEALNAKKIAIELKGSVLQEIEKEIKNEKRATNVLKLGRGAGAVGVTLGMLSPAGYIGLAGTALYALLFGASALALGANDINKYTMYSFYHNCENHILLIRTKQFDSKLDSIEGYENVVFNTSYHCPKCNKKGKKQGEVYFCASCGKKIVKNTTASVKK